MIEKDVIFTFKNIIMIINFRYRKEEIELKVPDNSKVYAPYYESVSTDVCEMLLESISNPAGYLPLNSQIKKRRNGRC